MLQDILTLRPEPFTLTRWIHLTEIIGRTRDPDYILEQNLALYQRVSSSQDDPPSLMAE